MKLMKEEFLLIFAPFVRTTCGAPCSVMVQANSQQLPKMIRLTSEATVGWFFKKFDKATERSVGYFNDPDSNGRHRQTHGDP